MLDKCGAPALSGAQLQRLREAVEERAMLAAAVASHRGLEPPYDVERLEEVLADLDARLQAAGFVPAASAAGAAASRPIKSSRRAARKAQPAAAGGAGSRGEFAQSGGFADLILGPRRVGSGVRVIEPGQEPAAPRAFTGQPIGPVAEAEFTDVLAAAKTEVLRQSEPAGVPAAAEVPRAAVVGPAVDSAGALRGEAEAAELVSPPGEVRTEAEPAHAAGEQAGLIGSESGAASAAGSADAQEGAAGAADARGVDVRSGRVGAGRRRASAGSEPGGSVRRETVRPPRFAKSPPSADGVDTAAAVSELLRVFERDSQQQPTGAAAATAASRRAAPSRMGPAAATAAAAAARAPVAPPKFSRRRSGAADPQDPSSWSLQRGDVASETAGGPQGGDGSGPSQPPLEVVEPQVLEP
jgi:hypothetical protein